MRGRFQFSLRSLLLAAIAIAAVTGFFFARVENARLRAEIDALRDDYGIVRIEDTERAWARKDPLTEDERFCFRIYVPTAGTYRIGIQLKDVAPKLESIDHAGAIYTAVTMPRGEVQLNVSASEYGESGVNVRWEMKSRDGKRLGGRGAGMEVKKDGFVYPLRHDIGGRMRPDFERKSITFDPAKPLVLLAFKSKRIIGEAKTPFGSSIDLADSDEPSPGLLLWFEKAPE
jgi:hypothetical protein